MLFLDTGREEEVTLRLVGRTRGSPFWITHDGVDPMQFLARDWEFAKVYVAPF
jgi:hypothetical protein